ncbi:MAG: ABC transporter ATP-binding protein [Pseudomonadota bacterium]
MLEVKRLSCAYGDIMAVEEVSFTVGRGEILGLIGANGAGKTTTIMALAGLIRPVAGRVILEGKDITSVPAHLRAMCGIALVPEGRRVFADLTVDENLTIGGIRLDKKADQRNRERVFQAFHRLSERRSQLAGSLSGGEQQMLALGRAMMAEPSVLLVDELSLGLMPIAIDECYRVLRHLRSEGFSILLVEQSTERVIDSSDRLAILDTGRLAWTGTGAEAIREGAILNAYLGETEVPSNS